MARKASVLFLGSPFWCQYLAGLLKEGQHLHAYTGSDVIRWLWRGNKSVCLVGIGPPDTYKRIVYHGVAYLMWKLGLVRKRVVYWIGSDVSRLKKGSRHIAGSFNIAGSSWLADEVRDRGYVCRERLFPVKLPIDDTLPFPDSDNLQVLCYVPDAHHDLHGSPEIRSAAEHCVDANFTIIGGTGTWWPEHPSNVRFLGWTNDMAGCLGSAHVLLRRTSHDSLSAFVREGLVAGRHVIFTYDVPGATYVRRGDVDSLLRKLEELVNCVVDDELVPNVLAPDIRHWLTDTDSQLRALADDYD